MAVISHQIVVAAREWHALYRSTKHLRAASQILGQAFTKGGKHGAKNIEASHSAEVAFPEALG